jgi:hypothetical protein
MNLYSMRSQDGNIVLIGQLDKIFVILLTFSEAVYEGWDQKLWNCASQATYWHSDGFR